MSLHAAWVDRVFDKLTLAYGRDFTGRWEGVDLNAVKSDWAHELSGFAQHPQAIAHGLQNLPDRCPNVFEFRALCRRANVQTLAIEHSPADPQRVAAELAKLAPIVHRQAPSANGKDWARRLIAENAQGVRSKSLPLQMAKAAIASKSGL